MRPVCAAFRGMHSFECELLWIRTFICWGEKKKRQKIFEMDACGALAAASVRVLGCYLGLKYIRGVGGELRAAAAEQEGMEETLQRETAGQINV